MSRHALALAFLVLAAGCAAPPEDAPTQEVEPVDDGWQVMATRVEPVRHDAEKQGLIRATMCAHSGRPDCPNPAAFVWDAPEFAFGDPQALFWRVALELEVAAEPARQPWVEIDLYATTECGRGCLRQEHIASSADGGASGEAFGLEVPASQDPLVRRLGPVDVFPDGHTGLTVVLRPRDVAQPTDDGITFHLSGMVGSYRPVADPVPVTMA